MTNDTVLLADSPEVLQHLMDRFASVCEIYGMRLNITKTKLMIISENPNSNEQFNTKEEVLEGIQNF